MQDINRKKYKGYIIYLHNFAKFDEYLLLKYLTIIGDCNSIIHKGRIISCKFVLFSSKYQVTFMNSLLMLPSSLRKLCVSFGSIVIEGKSIFPFKLNDINYNGVIPNYSLFDNTSQLEYENYKENFKNKVWDFKEAAIKYCELDCLTLYQIILKFSQLIWNHFRIQITKYPTLFSLAF